jgi:hypothetical protein
MSQSGRAEQLRKACEWEGKLYRLLDDMESFYGDPAPGTNPAKLESLTRFAWEEASDERKRLEQRP